MPSRKHEAVTIGPNGIFGIVTQELLPERVDYWRHRHGRSRMAGVGFLNCINAKCSNRVDAQCVEIRSARHSGFLRDEPKLQSCTYRAVCAACPSGVAPSLRMPHSVSIRRMPQHFMRGTELVYRQILSPSIYPAVCRY